MILDHSTKRNLEITFSMQDGSREGSLISILDKTQTAMGGRLLKKWISAPLRELDPIKKRHDSVEELFKNKRIRKTLNESLREIGDLERLISRICTGRANPREVIALKSSLKKIPDIKEQLKDFSVQTIKTIFEQLDPLEKIVEKISAAIIDSPPAVVNEGGIIRNGFSPELDELRDISLHGKEWIASLQQTERERTGIPSLKVSFNNVFGYYIDVSHTHKNKIPL
ncbi:MAG TPA: DNA mismatch repair protein MutS, partial [Ignavibacteriaceae bacterium]|nr:DNA mismatch repair protein MutS [Ignavibacteriaceae bacterium]